MTTSIYQSTDSTYNDKLYIAYAELNGGSANIYYMSKVKKPSTYDYHWRYTNTNPINDNDTFNIINNWEPTLSIPVISSYSTANYSEGQSGISNSPVTTNSPTSYNISLNKSEGNNNTITQDTGLNFNTTTGVISGTISQSTAGTYKYDITATNNGGTSNPYEITITIVDDIASPIIDYGSLTRNYTTLSPGETITPSINVASSWSISPDFPNYITFNNTNGTITVTPQSGITYNVSHIITATNTDIPPESDSKTLTFNITLALPQITGYSSTTVVEGQTVTLSPQGSYLSNASNTFNISTNTNNNGNTIVDEIGLSLNTSTGVISGTVKQQIEGTYNYTVSYSNSEGAGNDFTLTLSVQDDIDAPSINYSTTSYEFNIGTNQTIQAPTNTGGAISSWSMDSNTPLTNGLSLNTSTGVISGTITGTLTETKTFTVIASNTDNEISSATITITFKQPVPVITNYPVAHNYTEGLTDVLITPVTTNSPTSYSISLNKSEGNNNTITQDTGLSFNTTTGVISGTITQSTAGTYKYDITATNSGGTSNPYEITITIIDNIASPIIDYGSLTRNYTTLSPGETITPTINVTSSWSVSPELPSYISLNSNNGEIIVTPQSQTAYSGTHTVTATNSDSPQESDSKTFTFNITLATPQIIEYTSVSNNSISVIEGTSYTLTPSGTYLTGYGNNYTFTNTIGLTINSNTGVISGTISQNKAGTYNYTVNHSNSEGNGNDFIIAITVVDNIPDPTISYSASTYTGTVGESINIPAPTKTNVNTLSISPNLPDGLTLNADGSITGTPTSSSDALYTVTAFNNDTPTESVNTTIIITITSSVVNYTGLQVIPPMPNPSYPTSNITVGQPYVGITVSNNCYLFVYTSEPNYYSLALDKYTITNMSTSYSYTNISTTLPSLIINYSNNNLISKGQAYIGYDSSTSKLYFMIKLPNPDYNPGNIFETDSDTVYYRKEMTVMSRTNWNYNFTWSANSTFEPLPSTYSTENIENGQIFIGRTDGNIPYLIVHVPNPNNTNEKIFYEIQLSSANPDLDTSFTY